MDEDGFATCYSGDLDPIDCYAFMLDHFKGAVDKAPWTDYREIRTRDPTRVPMPGMKRIKNRAAPAEEDDDGGADDDQEEEEEFQGGEYFEDEDEEHQPIQES